MFICEKCGRQTEPHQKQHRIITEKRPKIYEGGSEGWEIVKELRACAFCKAIKIGLGE